MAAGNTTATYHKLFLLGTTGQRRAPVLDGASSILSIQEKLFGIFINPITV